ncbi:hypothetical protein ACFQPF_16200 [Fictibacillus iocasae]|uniref:Phosphatase n=1 Tax=Fictibacillus iocasae TaxID=2715437 RepID=A0ABW2NUY2_9BACL
MKKMKYITYSFIAAVVIAYFARQSVVPGGELTTFHEQMIHWESLIDLLTY